MADVHKFQPKSDKGSNGKAPMPPPQVICPILTHAKLREPARVIAPGQSHQEAVPCLGQQCAFFNVVDGVTPDGQKASFGGCAILHIPNVLMGLFQAAMARIGEKGQAIAGDPKSLVPSPAPADGNPNPAA